MTRPPAADAKPEHWYKQFWPWFLIALPTAVVIASFVTLNIAIQNADSPVHDDYSKEGFAIQHNDRADATAAQQHIRAAIAVGEDNSIAVELRGELSELPPLLTLQCIHAFDARRDITVALARSGDRYTGVLPDTAYGKWRIEVRPPNSAWRLSGKVDLQRGAQLLLPL